MMNNLAAQMLKEIEQAESMALPGSHEHSQYLKAALYARWPAIKAILMMGASAAALHQQTGGATDAKD